MYSIGMIGSHLIHTYVYGVQFNSANLRKAREAENLPSWQLEIMENNSDRQPIEGATITHIWGKPEGLPEDMAAVFNMHVAEDLGEVLENCDLIMVLDEDIDSRVNLVRKALQAGCHVFADKVLGTSPSIAQDLINLAQNEGVKIASWSQAGYSPELEDISRLPQGGSGYVTYNMKPGVLEAYGIHIISTIQGAFPGYICSYRPLLADDQRLALLETDQGTEIVLAAGPIYPKWARVYYSVDQETTLVKAQDRFGAFRRSARDIIGMLEGSAPKFSLAHLVEASHLVNLFLQNKSDGQPIKLPSE